MKRKDIKKTIKEYFLQHPTKRLRVREIEREAKVPLPSVLRYTRELVEEGILKTWDISNIRVYEASRASEQFLLEKRCFNLKALYTSGLIDYCRNQLDNAAMVVFGSYAKGEDTEKSDIDLYIQSDSKKKINLLRFEKKLRKTIHVIMKKKIPNSHLMNNIINGITLNGFLEVLNEQGK